MMQNCCGIKVSRLACKIWQEISLSSDSVYLPYQRRPLNDAKTLSVNEGKLFAIKRVIEIVFVAAINT